MTAREELGWVRSRIGVLDLELVQLRGRLDAIEAGLDRGEMRAAGPAAGEIARPPAGSVEAATAAAPTARAVPPVLPADPKPEFREESETPMRAIDAPVFRGAADPAGTEVEAGAESGPTAADRWREWLEPLQLWPPAGEADAEVRLAAWWATRLGALLAVIGVVFLGVYVSRESPPWVRLAEVAGVTAAALGLGFWLERRLPRFGAVVVGAGLALGYFCAFAAHAVPAMRVIESASTAMAVELAVVTGIFAAAWRRGSPVVATMAVALGHVSAFLALRGGPAGFGPWVVLLLGIAAVALRLSRRWPAPSALAMPLAWLYLAVAADAGEPGARMSAVAVWFWTALQFALFMARDWLAALRGEALTTTDRAVQVANSTLAVGVAWMAAARGGGDGLAAFYFAAGAGLLAVTAAWQRAGVAALVPVFVCKGAGMVALGVVAQFDGGARYLALLAQTAVMLVSAANSRVRGLHTATVVMAVTAVIFFVAERRDGPAELMAGATFAETVFVVGVVGLVGAARRWLAWTDLAALAGAGLAGALAAGTAMAWSLHPAAPAASVLLAALMAGGGMAVGARREAGLAAAVVAIVAHGLMVQYPKSGHASAAIWANMAVLAAGAWAAGVGAGRAADATLCRGVRRGILAATGGTLVVVLFKALPGSVALALVALLAGGLVAGARRATGWPLAGAAAPLLALGFGLGVGEGSLGRSPWLWGAMVAAWIPALWGREPDQRLASIRSRGWRERAAVVHTLLATAITWYAVHRMLAGEARIAGLVAVALAVFAFAVRRGAAGAVEGSWVLWVSAGIAAWHIGPQPAGWVAVVAAWLPAVFAGRGIGRAPGSFLPWCRNSETGVQVAIALLVGAGLASRQAGVAELWALGGVLGLAGVAWRLGVDAARPALVGGLAFLWLRAAFHVGDGAGVVGNAPGWGAAFATILAVTGLAAGAPFPLGRGWAERPRRMLRWVGAVAGLLLSAWLWLPQQGALAAYATVGLGGSAAALFLTGLAARSRPHRLVGLAGLAVCVARAFFVDLDSTLHRIAAFVALGVVLLWVGFSYHRFRHLIVEREE